MPKMLFIPSELPSILISFGEDAVASRCLPLADDQVALIGVRAGELVGQGELSPWKALALVGVDVIEGRPRPLKRTHRQRTGASIPGFVEWLRANPQALPATASFQVLRRLKECTILDHNEALKWLEEGLDERSARGLKQAFHHWRAQSAGLSRA